MNVLKRCLPNRLTAVPILWGPFRGARIVMNPRDSVRKILGVYEHELNPWIADAVGRVGRVIDVGANDGYFAFGCAAAFRRLAKDAEIIAIEPQRAYVKQLEESKSLAGNVIQLRILRAIASHSVSEDSITLDSLATVDRRNTLVKIDVEGAELDVLKGSASWMNPSNLFLIEVHREKYLREISGLFAEVGLTLSQIDQKPLPLLGRERRVRANWWLVSTLSSTL